MKNFIFYILIFFTSFARADVRADWRFDELELTGTTGGVTDSSGYGNNGTAINGLTTAAGLVCRAGFFRGEGYNEGPLNSFFPARYFVRVPSRPSLSPQTSGNNAELTIAGWFNSRTSSGTIIHKGDGNNQEYRVFIENNRLNFTIWNRNNNPQTYQSSFVLQTNQFYYFVAALTRKGNSSNYDVILQIYNANSNTALSSQLFPISIQINENNLAGNLYIGAVSFGTNNITNYFDGLIDELTIHSTLLTSSEILFFKNRRRSCSGQPALNHIQLALPAPTVRCLAAPIQLSACASEDCSSLATENVAVTLQAGNGFFSGDAISQASGSTAVIMLESGQAAVALNALEAASNIINLVQTDPELSSSDSLRCYQAGIRVACAVFFTDIGMVFADASTNSTSLMHGVAGVTQSARLGVIQINPQTGACQARTSGTRAVQFAMQCVNPKNCISGQNLLINNQSVASNPQGDFSLRTLINVNFGSDGFAPFNYVYSDVGAIALFAELVLPENNDGPGISLNTQSNNFVIRPHTLTFLEASQIPFVANSNPGTTNSGSGFWPAGRPFRLIAEPRNAQGQRTPNFGNETPAQRLTAEYAELVYPAAGIGNAALFSPGTFEPVANANIFPGRQGSSGAIWQEAGTIRLRMGLINNSYLGTGDALNKPVSGNIGRFYPAALALTEASTQPACHSGFSYMAQPAIALNYQLQALGDPASGSRLLQNYDSGLYTGTAQFAVVAKNTTLGNERLNLGDRLVVNSGTWQSGIYQVIQSDLRFNRQSNQQPDGPFADLQLGLQVVSELDNRPLLNPDFNAGLSGSCGANCNALRLGNTLALRYGRLVLDNAFGPEFDTLPLTLRAEFWDGQRFVENTLDSCTPVDVVNLIQLSGAVNPVKSGTAAALQVGRSSPLALLLAPPGVSAQLSYQYNGPPWLTFNWDGSANYNQQPQNEVIFGRFRGNPRLIFWREQ